MTLKRLFDLIASTSALVILAPMLLFIAIAVRCDSRGPALFRQVRVGRGGRPFRILKFRTMIHEAGFARSDIAQQGDTRVTRLGRFLRRTKLDELPQLFNVATGEMSLVGPRPELPEFVALYPDEAAREILSIRPGVTDLASLEFYDEAKLLDGRDTARIYNEEILPRKLSLQRRYVQEQSMALDIGIIFRTLLKIVRLP